eukprot:g4278.t1
MESKAIGNAEICDLARRGATKRLRSLYNGKDSFDVNLHDSLGVTPLIAACTLSKDAYRPHKTHPKTVKFLLRRGANVNAADKLGYTALHEASRAGATNICVTLIIAGADPNMKSIYGETPLDLAPKGALADKIRLIFETEADTMEEKFPDMIGDESETGLQKGKRKKKKRAKKKNGADYKPSVEICDFQREVLDLELPDLDGKMDQQDLQEYQELLQEELNEQVNTELAEKYIPVVVMELIQKLVNIARKSGTKEEDLHKLEQIFRLCSYHIQVSLIDEAQEISRNYAEFEIDRDTKDIIADSKTGQEEMRKLFRMDFKQYVLNANFKIRSHQWVESKVGAKSSGGMSVSVRYNIFHPTENGTPDYTIFTRGEHIVDKKVEPYGVPYLHYILGWRIEKISVFKRLLIMYRLADKPLNKPKKKEIRNHHIYLKLFRDFPEDDIEMIMPESQPVLTLMAWALIVTPILSGLSAMASRIPALVANATDAGSAAASSSALIEFLTFLAVTASYFFKSYQQYSKQRQAFQTKLNGILYEKLLSCNGSCVAQLHKEAGSQEQRESILAYFFLLYKMILPQQCHDKDNDENDANNSHRDDREIKNTEVVPERKAEEEIVVQRRPLGEICTTSEVDDMVESLMIKLKLSNKDPIDFDVRDALEGLVRNGLVKRYTSQPREQVDKLENERAAYIAEQRRRENVRRKVTDALQEKSKHPAVRIATKMLSQVLKPKVTKGNNKVAPHEKATALAATPPPGKQYSIVCDVDSFGIKFRDYPGVGVQVEQIIEGGEVATKFPQIHVGHILIQANNQFIDPSKNFQDVMQILRTQKRPLKMTFVIVQTETKENVKTRSQNEKKNVTEKNDLDKTLTIPHECEEGKTIDHDHDHLLNHKKEDLASLLTRVKTPHDQMLRRMKMRSFRSASSIVPQQPHMALTLMTARLIPALSEAPEILDFNDEDDYDRVLMRSVCEKLS